MFQKGKLQVVSEGHPIMVSLDREPSLHLVDKDYTACYKSLKNISQHTSDLMKELMQVIAQRDGEKVPIWGT